MSADWIADALCAQIGEDPFYVTKGGSLTLGKRLCQRCEARGDCLILAMRAEAGRIIDRFGIFGGLSPQERQALSERGWQPGDPTPPISFRNRKPSGLRAVGGQAVAG